LVPWPPVDIHGKFYGDCPRGTPPAGGLNERGVVKYSDFGPIEGSRKRCKIDGKLVLITNRKSYMSFRLVPKSVTLNGVMALILCYFTKFMYDIIKKFTFAVSSTDEFLVSILSIKD